MTTYPIITSLVTIVLGLGLIFSRDVGFGAFLVGLGLGRLIGVGDRK